MSASGNGRRLTAWPMCLPMVAKPRDRATRRSRNCTPRLVLGLDPGIGRLAVENDSPLGAYAAPLGPRSPLRWLKGSNDEPRREETDDPTRSPQAEHQSSVPTGEAEPLCVRLRTGRDRRRDAGGADGDRQGLHQISVLRQPPDYSLSAPGGDSCWPTSCPARSSGKRFTGSLSYPSSLRIMGLETIYKRPRTSQPHPAHLVYPYLLKNLAVDRPNQVWCADITFVPVLHGFLYLVAMRKS